MYTSCEYLVNIVGNGVIKPVLDKVGHMMAARTFLGLTGYFRSFVPSFASVAAPLTDLTKMSVPNSVVWNEECEGVFKALKNMLCSDPVLNSPDFKKGFIVQTEASDRGVGAVLSWRRWTGTSCWLL